MLIVTPAFWPDQQKWYLNVNVYGTTATEGIFGKLATATAGCRPSPTARRSDRSRIRCISDM